MSKKTPNVSTRKTLIFAISALTAMTTLASCKENTESYEKITE